jgi:hypothetical protein
MYPAKYKKKIQKTKVTIFTFFSKFALYYFILEESVYFYNPDHVKSDYFYRKG